VIATEKFAISAFSPDWDRVKRLGHLSWLLVYRYNGG